MGHGKRRGSAYTGGGGRGGRGRGRGRSKAFRRSRSRSDRDRSGGKHRRSSSRSRHQPPRSRRDRRHDRGRDHSPQSRHHRDWDRSPRSSGWRSRSDERDRSSGKNRKRRHGPRDSPTFDPKYWDIRRFRSSSSEKVDKMDIDYTDDLDEHTHIPKRDYSESESEYSTDEESSSERERPSARRPPVYLRERPRDPDFANTLQGFGYCFNEDGKLLHLITQSRFVYQVQEDENYNKRHYEALEDVITEYIYELLEKETRLMRFRVPLGRDQNILDSFIFVTYGSMFSTHKLMVFIQDTGEVRAGQWSQRVIINDGLAQGSQIPFILKAQKEGYDIIVLNPNRNHLEINDKMIAIPENFTPDRHVNYVWKRIITKLRAKQIFIVAHRSGGRLLVSMVENNFGEVKKRVRKIALMDSSHSLQALSRAASHWLTTHSRNWVCTTSEASLNAELVSNQDLPKYSAGTSDPDQVPSNVIHSVFSYFSEYP